MERNTRWEKQRERERETERDRETEREIEREKQKETETDRQKGRFHAGADVLCTARDLFVCLFAFLTSSSTTRLYRGRVPRLTSDNFTCCHTRDREMK